MKIRTMAAAAAALSLAAAPAVAEVSFDRASAPVEAESELGGGAILGALIMQSLQSGMAMVGVDAPFQNIVVGAVLVLAVLVDTIYRMRTGAK